MTRMSRLRSQPQYRMSARGLSKFMTTRVGDSIHLTQVACAHSHAEIPPFYCTLIPLAPIVTVLSPTSTLQTPFVLLALAVIGAQPTRRSVMNSAAVDGCALANLPWYWTCALGSNGAALVPTSSAVPHER